MFDPAKAACLFVLCRRGHPPETGVVSVGESGLLADLTSPYRQQGRVSGRRSPL